MTRAVKYFMWGFQRHFRTTAHACAGHLFKNLGGALEPYVFVAGIPAASDPRRLAVLVDPDDCRYQPEFFDALGRYWEEAEKDAPGFGRSGRDPATSDSRTEQLRQESLNGALRNLLNERGSEIDTLFYASAPVLVDQHYVTTIIALPRSAVFDHPRLTRRSIDGIPVPTSLVDAAAQYFLNLCSEELKKPNPGSGVTLSLYETDEILRVAGRRLAGVPAIVQRQYESHHLLFSICTELAALQYEGRGTVARIAIASPDHPELDYQLRFKDSISLHQTRAIRKLLETTSGRLYLVSDSECAFGLAELRGEYDGESEDLFEILFASSNHWTLVHHGERLMEVQFGLPSLPKASINLRKLRADLLRLFREIRGEHADRLCELVLEATRQKKGTMLVISSEAASEALRLNRQCIPVTPVELSPLTLRHVSAIDGAILLSPDGKCFGISAILDGQASHKADPSRGARYNSAVRYIEEYRKQHACLAIVVSEDGTVDCVPDLMPQIRRSMIMDLIERLRGVAEADTVDQKEFSQVIRRFRELEFYLTAEMCAEINDVKRRIDQRLSSDVSTRMRFVTPDFTHNGDIDDSYFVD